MKRMRNLAIILAVLACGTLFAGGQKDAAKDGSGKTPLRLYTYYADTDVAVVDYAVSALKQKYPVEIEVTHRSDATGVELKTMAAVGNLPDIFEVTGEALINTFLESGNIIPMEDAMKKYGATEKVSPVCLSSLKNPDGHTYAINFEAPTNFLIYYNKAVFDTYKVKLPTNYDEFLSATKTFAQNGIIPLALFGAEPWPGIQLYDYLVTRRNAGGLKALMEGKAKITDPDYVKAAEQMVELVNAGLIGKSAFVTNASQAFEYYKTGKAAMVANGTWFLLDVAEYGTGYGYLDNPLAVPGKEAETLYVRSGGSSQGGWTVNPKGKNLDLAKEIAVEYCIQRATARVTLFGAANPLTFEVKPEKPRHSAAQKYSDEIQKFKSTTYFPWNFPNSEIASAFNDNNQALLAGSLTVDKFIAEMDKVIKANR